MRFPLLEIALRLLESCLTIVQNCITVVRNRSTVAYLRTLGTRCDGPHGTGMKDRTRSVSFNGANTVLRAGSVGVTARQGRRIAPKVSESA